MDNKTAGVREQAEMTRQFRSELNHHPKRIVLFNDLPGYGKVALAAMVPLISHIRYQLQWSPTHWILESSVFRI